MFFDTLFLNLINNEHREERTSLWSSHGILQMDQLCFNVVLRSNYLLENIFILDDYFMKINSSTKVFWMEIAHISELDKLK